MKVKCMDNAVMILAYSFKPPGYPVDRNRDKITRVGKI